METFTLQEKNKRFQELRGTVGRLIEIWNNKGQSVTKEAFDFVKKEFYKIVEEIAKISTDSELSTEKRELMIFKDFILPNLNYNTTDGGIALREILLLVDTRLDRMQHDLKNIVDETKGNVLNSLKISDSNETNLESPEVKFFNGLIRGKNKEVSLEGELSNEQLANGLEQALFKVFNIEGNRAEFEYCGGVTNQDFFRDVASFTNNPYDIPNKTDIITIKPGKVRKIDDKRVVEEKAKIKFLGS